MMMKDSLTPQNNINSNSYSQTSSFTSFSLGTSVMYIINNKIWRSDEPKAVYLADLWYNQSQASIQHT